MTIRHVAHILGKLVSTFPASTYGPLYYRYLEKEKIAALKLSKGDYDQKMTLGHKARDDLYCWLNNIQNMYAPIQKKPITKQMTTDASKNKGWGAAMEEISIGGAWKASYKPLFQNCYILLSKKYIILKGVKLVDT